MSWEAVTWASRQRCGTPAAQLVLLNLANWADVDGFVKHVDIGRLAHSSLQSRRNVFRTLAAFEEWNLLKREEGPANPKGQRWIVGQLDYAASVDAPLETRRPRAPSSDGDTPSENGVDFGETEDDDTYDPKTATGNVITSAPPFPGVSDSVSLTPPFPGVSDTVSPTGPEVGDTLSPTSGPDVPVLSGAISGPLHISFLSKNNIYPTTTTTLPLTTRAKENHDAKTEDAKADENERGFRQVEASPEGDSETRSPAPAAGPGDEAVAFDTFRRVYPFDATMDVRAAREAFAALSARDRARACRGAAIYAAAMRERNRTHFADAARWLRDGRFEDIVNAPAPGVASDRHVFVRRGTDAWRAWVAAGHPDGLDAMADPVERSKTGWMFPSLFPAPGAVSPYLARKRAGHSP